VIFKQTAPPPPTSNGFLFGGPSKKSQQPFGYEVVVNLPETGGTFGEVVATGRLFGEPTQEFIRTASEAVPKLLDGIRKTLCNFRERRKHTRVPASFPVTVFPLHSDGRVESPLNGKCQDVSAGGASVQTTAPFLTSHAYLAFEGVRGTTGLAVLMQVIRAPSRENGFVLAGRYRLDLVMAVAEAE
jgi:hypothetical protein